jgi:hypothetical protein
MENQPEVGQVNQVNQKPNNFLVILLSILLLISCVIAGFFAYQTQELVKELTKTRSLVISSPISTPTIDPTANWKTYYNTKANYSLKYPVSDWKILNTGVIEEKEAGQDSTNVGLIYQPDISKAAHELVFIITPSVPETDKNKLNQTKEIGDNYLANCWITEDNGYEFCWLKNSTQGGYLNINFNISKDENINSMIDQIFSTFKFIDNTKEEACIKEKYTWLSKYNECESPILTETFCKKEKGTFYGCESACRHEDPNGICTTECIAVCKFD